MRRPLAPGLAALLGSLLAAFAAMASPVLHERLAVDPAEDAALGATTSDGKLPAALRTARGTAITPDATRAAAGAASADDGPFRPDRDTRQPDAVAYADPFTPSVAPFARLRAYDAVAADGSLVVRDARPRPLRIGGEIAAGEDAFYLDLEATLAPGVDVRLPTPGAGARPLRLFTEPEVPFDLARDGAEAWVLRPHAAARVRVRGLVAVPRASFDPALAPTTWGRLGAPPLPPALAREAEIVARAAGASREQTPSVALAALVAYFRGFAPTDAVTAPARDAYLDLALGKRGVCRHRAYAFVVTALGLGLPARMITNDAHAWVEVSDGARWHRVDLGGAALELASDPREAAREPHAPPPDPFPWPAGAAPGSGLVASAADAPAAAPSGASGASGATGASGGTAPRAAASSAVSQDDARPASDVTADVGDVTVRRSAPLHVAGSVRAAGAPCAGVRVDVALDGPSLRAPVALGAVATDAAGRFDGAVTLPYDAPLGDFALVLSTSGNAACGRGEAVFR